MIKSLDHVTLIVHDLEAAVEQYKKIFDTDDVRIGQGTPGNGYRAASFYFGDNQRVEIITPIDETGPWARHLAKHGDGIYLFGFLVDDLEQTTEAMRARGVRMPEPIRGLQVIHPASAAGSLVLLMQEPTE